MFNNKTSPGYSRPPTSQEAVLGEIRRAIMSRELQPGERVRQEQLAERLNVSRVLVREALKVLEAEGQVTYQAHRGYTVVALSLEELEEIYLARSLLEKEMTRRAVPKVDAGLIRHLESSIARMGDFADTGDVLGYAEANWDFHFALFERAGLSRIYRIVEVLWRVSEAYRGARLTPTGRRRGCGLPLRARRARRASEDWPHRGGPWASLRSVPRRDIHPHMARTSQKG